MKQKQYRNYFSWADWDMLIPSCSHRCQGTELEKYRFGFFQATLPVWKCAYFSICKMFMNNFL